MRAFGIRGVTAHIANQEVEQTVAVIVEEDGAGRMRGQVHACLPGDIPESSVSVVLEQHIAASNRGDEQVRITVVIDISEGRADADPARNSRTRLAGHVSELAAPRFFHNSFPPTWLEK